MSSGISYGRCDNCNHADYVCYYPETQQTLCPGCIDNAEWLVNRIKKLDKKKKGEMWIIPNENR